MPNSTNHQTVNTKSRYPWFHVDCTFVPVQYHISSFFKQPCKLCSFENYHFKMMLSWLTYFPCISMQVPLPQPRPRRPVPPAVTSTMTRPTNSGTSGNILKCNFINYLLNIIYSVEYNESRIPHVNIPCFRI